VPQGTGRPRWGSFVFQADQIPEIRRLIGEQAARDKALLDELLAEVAAIGQIRIIKPRSATSVALMAADGGNNRVAFNPFYLQLIRVVDSHGKELFMDVVSPTTDILELSRRRHLDDDGPRSPLGRLMLDLGVSDLHELSPMMNSESAGWVLTYRDLCEWATLYELICSRRFAQDTLLVHDGLLRCKLFRGDLFIQMYELIKQHIDRVYTEDRRRIWLVGLAKKSEVLERYRLAISLSRVFERGSPCFVAVPEAMQERVYRWAEYTRAPDDTSRGEKPKFNMGAMHFVRFGTRSGDPVWTVDLLDCQKSDAQAVFGYLLADAVAGFPVPFYPNCLQQADNHSRVADLDLDIVEDNLMDAIRDQVGPDLAPIIDELRMASDVAARRYE
jgi:hypothetical protein